MNDLPHEMRMKILSYVTDETLVETKHHSTIGWEVKLVLEVIFSPLDLHVYRPAFHHVVTALAPLNNAVKTILREIHDPAKRRKRVIGACVQLEGDFANAKKSRMDMIKTVPHRMVFSWDKCKVVTTPGAEVPFSEFYE